MGHEVEMRYMVHHNHEGEMAEVVHDNVDEMMLVHRVGILMMVHGTVHNHEVDMEGVVPQNGNWENYDAGEMRG